MWYSIKWFFNKTEGVRANGPDYYYLPLSLYGRILYGASIGILTAVCRLCGPWQEAVAYVCLLLGFIYSLWRFCQIRFRK